MRENKFRAWDKKGKKMFIVRELRFFKTGELDVVIVDYSNYGDEIVRALNDVDLIQYTGLKDKSGKEIWEGDIVKCKLSSTQRYKGIIQFKAGHFFIHAFWYSFKPIGRWDLEKRKLCGKSSTNLSIDCEMQIIGNIYENPEILNHVA